nr:UDP-N-acetylmuramoyl-L-alanyl-D-glutamate--2,6-diaminopimelate ligase [bacterium]
LQKLLSRMREKGADSCAMEVSSHALAQERVAGCHFDAAIFTNLTPEHLDYHSDMESYFEAKALLFEELLANSGKENAFAAINVDDPYGRDLKKRCPVPVCTYGLSSSADVRASDLSFDASGLSMRVTARSGSFACRSALCGKFNALNILGAATAAEGMGIGLSAIEEAVSGVEVVPGRFESVANSKGILTLVDYAHTPDALENALSNARELTRGRLIAVFGCGGDRDRAKRPMMGRAAGSLADVAIVTSDNPRTEEPSAIIGEILPGVREVSSPFDGERGYEVVEDRREAIGRAVEIAREGDVVVVAGKGHEDYQIVGTVKRKFDDREVLKEFLEGGR